jgi:hypothetical protein
MMLWRGMNAKHRSDHQIGRWRSHDAAGKIFVPGFSTRAIAAQCFPLRICAVSMSWLTLLRDGLKSSVSAARA